MEDEEELEERNEDLEFKHNFRFEQPGADSIPTFGRNIEGSLRRPDTRRKEKRDAIKQRKTEEEAKDKEELKRLKNLKKKEIEKRLRDIERVGGVSLGDKKESFDLDSDFDPEEHDKKMAKLYDDEYYGVKEKDLLSSAWPHPIQNLKGCPKRLSNTPQKP